jgi:hypothetical protein
LFDQTGLERYEFNIPAAVPSGKYLVRIEHIGVHNAANYGGAQFFVACGQVEVTGGGSGTPGPLVAFPGEYKPDHPGIYFNNYYPNVSYPNLKAILGIMLIGHSQLLMSFLVHPFGVNRETRVPVRQDDIVSKVSRSP